MISEILFLVKQIRPRRTQIDDLGAPIAVFLQARAFEAVEGVRDALAAAHDALVLIIAEGTFVADSGEGRGANVGIANGAFAVAFIAEAADGDSCLLATHDEIWMMARHF